jgi:hypothetical protein
MDLTPLEGQELSSITFVQDYVQLDFNGPAFTFLIWPEVFRPEGSYAFGEPGYRDMLCEQIAHTVESSSIEENIALEIAFEDGVIFRVSLRDEDYVGPEAVHFSTGNPNDPPVIF